MIRATNFAGKTLILALGVAAALWAEMSPASGEEPPARLDRLEKMCRDRIHALPRESLGEEEALALASLSCRKARQMSTSYWTVGDRFVEDELDRAEASLKSADRSVPIRSGLVEMAYFSPVDATVQPWIFALPKDLARKPKAGWASIVFLHGYAGYLDESNWLEMMIPESLFDMAERIGFAVILPFGRGNVDFLGVGERDVMDVLDIAQKKLGLDPKRVILSGLSMGGAGVWCVASHYPDRFAGVVPLAGRSDYFLWKKWRREETPAERLFVADLDYLWPRRENVLSLPSFIFHASQDYLIEPEQSQKIFDYLTSQGSESRLKLYEGESHWIGTRVFEEEEIAEWVLRLPPRQRPKSFSIATLSPDYGQAFGLSIVRIAEWTKMARVTAKEKGGKLSLTSENVSEIRVSGGVETANLAIEPAPDERTVEKGIVTLRFGPPPTQMEKRPGLCGPIRQAYDRPFLMVTGRGESAKSFERASRLWRDFAFGEPRSCSDQDLTQEDIERYHLILFGTPDENIVVQRIAHRLPVRWDQGSIRVGDRLIEMAPGMGFSGVYPNPENPDRLVVWHVGETWGTGLESNHVLDFLPDYIVFESDLLRDGSNRVQCAGFYDSHWQWDARLCRFEETTPGRPEGEGGRPAKIPQGDGE